MTSMTLHMLDKPIEVDVNEYNFFIRYWHEVFNRSRLPHKQLVRYRMAMCTIGLGLALGCTYALMFHYYIKLDTIWDNAIQVVVVLTASMSAILTADNFKASDDQDDKKKKQSNMDFLIDKIFKAIIHSICVTSFVEIIGGKITDPVSLFSGLIMNHLIQSFY